MAQQYKRPHVTTNSTYREGLQKSFFAPTVSEVGSHNPSSRPKPLHLNILKIAVKLPLSYGYIRITTAVETAGVF